MSEQPAGGVPVCYRHPGREAHIRCQRCGKSICPDCMREASVGFQCPDCVAEGAKSTRAGRTAYGGLRPETPGRATLVLMAISGVVWLAVTATGGNDSPLVAWLMMLGDGRCTLAGDVSRYFTGVESSATCSMIADGRWLPGVLDGGVWRLLTHAFTHVEWWHIGMNMLALWQLGPVLERILGTARFLALYLLSALAGGVAVLWLTGTGSAVGASGAIFGLLAAQLVVARKAKVDLSQFGFTLVLAVAISLAPGVSWQGHLGGFLGGLAVGAALIYAPRERRTTVQTAGCVAVGVLLVAATAVRMLI
ncbi:membrane associated rhomboid family serine protease [Nocardioides thalensis]|uniref:Membrane associated rhomboid family serine protease n=1 Tax=Nocardioides thalensis TaxID=1914755 RepID=A0A853CBQ9_9ACTN|nr:rhomboid family intramembrane serine protease [Nocardioides thalensis]NYJ03613.1 membrane associated rhomboid family serine protease [Nocardioides thalensis]